MLDIGCNAGFYSLEMKRRGAERVVGIDDDERILEQARFAAGVEGLAVEYRRMSVWEIGALGERFDLVIFMGVLYHLRYPLLALDLIHEHVAKDLLLFQSMQRGSRGLMEIAGDYDFNEQEFFNEWAYPKLHFMRRVTAATRPTGGCRTAPARRPCCGRPDLPSSGTRRRRSTCAAASRWSTGSRGRMWCRRTPNRGERELACPVRDSC